MRQTAANTARHDRLELRSAFPGRTGLLRRTSVFVNGFTLKLAATITELSESDAFNIVTSLVEKSLLNASQRMAKPIWMLESIRAFGLERLEQHGEVAAARQAHLSYFFARVEANYSDDELTGIEEHWYGQMDLEFEDVRSAFRWAQQTATTSALLRLGTAVGYSTARPFTREAIVQLAAGIESAPDAPARLRSSSRYTGIAMQWAEGSPKRWKSPKPCFGSPMRTAIHI